MSDRKITLSELYRLFSGDEVQWGSENLKLLPVSTEDEPPNVSIADIFFSKAEPPRY